MGEEELGATMPPLSLVGSSEFGLGDSGITVQHSVIDWAPVGPWATLLEALPTPVMILGTTLHVRFANAQARRLLDAAAWNVNGQPARRFLDGARLDRALEVLATRPGIHSYHDVLSIFGVEIPIDVSVTLATIDGGEQILLTLEDRSAERRERAEWAQHRASAVRSEPPAAQLQQAQHFEALGHLMGTFAHDLNNLLTVILSSLEVAQRRMEDGRDPSADLERALLATERSVRTTAEVLSYARRRELHAPGVDPVRVLGDVRGLLERALGVNGELEIRTETCPLVGAESTQLETVLLNLVVNARDALGMDGHVVVECRPIELSGPQAAVIGLLPGVHVCLSVTDDGQGMSEEVRTHAFDPFFTTKAEGKGTGLGLSTVRAFAQRFGGVVTLHSRVDVGTRVELWLVPWRGEAEPTAR
ncbi:MAG TPA: ATP-binding protein [Polyangiaceae bacterium]|nr:ATP-binding protein [Polyangiaceae bacterium]